MINRNNTLGIMVARKLLPVLALAVLVIWMLPQLAQGAAATTSDNPGLDAPAATQDFEDVPTTDPFYSFLHKIGPNGSQIVSGYTCGGPGEPCVAPGNLPYYRSSNAVTRLQMSKFVDFARTQPGININTATSLQPLYSGTSAAGGVGVEGASTGAGGVGVKASGGPNSTALQIDNGAIKVSGANKSVFIHITTASNTISTDTTIDNTFSNGDPNAILIVTPHIIDTTIDNSHPISVYYFTSLHKWVISNQDGAVMLVNRAFNVLVVKQ